MFRANSLNDRTAMTLAELLIASVLVGIVTLGLIAAEQTIRMSRQSSHRDAQVTAQLQAAMSLISHDANMTVGDFSNLGIFVYRAAGKGQTICFRHANGDVNTYTDDRWYCWSFDEVARILWNCRDLATTANPCWSRTLAAGETRQSWGRLTDPIFFKAIDTNGNEILQHDRVLGGGVNFTLDYIELNLTSRFDPSRPEHPIENPAYTLRTRISPIGVSR